MRWCVSGPDIEGRGGAQSHATSWVNKPKLLPSGRTVGGHTHSLTYRTNGAQSATITSSAFATLRIRTQRNRIGRTASRTPRLTAPSATSDPNASCRSACISTVEKIPHAASQHCSVRGGRTETVLLRQLERVVDVQCDAADDFGREAVEGCHRAWLPGGVERARGQKWMRVGVEERQARVGEVEMESVGLLIEPRSR